MGSKEIVIESALIINLKNNVSSAKMDIKELAEKDTETTIAGNTNSTECYDVCVNVIKDMNMALKNDTEKIERLYNAFNDFDDKVAQLFSKK